MHDVPFESAVAIWRLASDDAGVIRNQRLTGVWSLGGAISYVMAQMLDEQWRFAVLSGNTVLDDLDMRRIASTAIFKSRFPASG